MFYKLVFYSLWTVRYAWSILILLLVSFFSSNTYIARCDFAEDWLRLGIAENKFSLCSHLALSLRVFEEQNLLRNSLKLALS